MLSTSCYITRLLAAFTPLPSTKIGIMLMCHIVRQTRPPAAFPISLVLDMTSDLYQALFPHYVSRNFVCVFFLFGFILLPFSLRHYLCYRNATVDKLNPLNNRDTEEIIRWTGWVTQAEGSTGCRFCLDRAKKLILTFAA